MLAQDEMLKGLFKWKEYKQHKKMLLELDD